VQPLLHDLVVAVAAPTAALSGADGQIRAVGVQDVFHADVRVLAEAVRSGDGGYAGATTTLPRRPDLGARRHHRHGHGGPGRDRRPGAALGGHA